MTKQRADVVIYNNAKVVKHHLQRILDGGYNHPVEQEAILRSCINYMNQNLSLYETYLVKEES